LEDDLNPTSQVRADFDRIALVSGEGWNHNDHYHPYLLKHLPHNCQTALDVGCGTGTFARLLAARSQQVVAIDLSPEMIRIARESSIAWPQIDYRVIDLMEWDIPNESFDCIASIATLHHLSLESVLPKLRDALKPGGVLMVLDLYRAETVGDVLRSLAAIPLSVAYKWAKAGRVRQSEEARQAWEAHGANDVYPPVSAVRACCDQFLPGAVVRKHLFWRYSLIWQKPT